MDSTTTEEPTRAIETPTEIRTYKCMPIVNIAKER